MNPHMPQLGLFAGSRVVYAFWTSSELSGVKEMNTQAKPEKSDAITRHRTGGRAGRIQSKQDCDANSAVMTGVSGGTYTPLSQRDMARIHETALDVLENIGMADPVPRLLEAALEKGCTLSDKGRLLFPRALVEDCIAGTPKTTHHLSRDKSWDIELSGKRVYFDPGGEAVSTLDIGANTYRPSTLVDLYDFARLTDNLGHLDTFGKVVVPTDVPNLRSHDINTAYVSLAGTRKHVGLGFMDVRHMDDALEMVHMLAGGERAYRDHPFCSSGGCPVVSPLTYGEDNTEVCIDAPRFHGAVSVVIAPQAGATAPAALAGTLVQTTAETLAALMIVQLTTPGHPVSFGAWPFVSDLRTGSFSGGGGEQALLAAAAGQIGKFYDLPCSVGAGMTDSKAADNQAGYERGITTVLSALAGSNVISEVGGTMGSLLGCSFEAMVIDNEMLGMIKRVVRGIEVTEETLSYHVIEDAVYGAGHYLGHPQTLELMNSEYLYPTIADRTSPGEWEENGSHDIRDKARLVARDILATHYPVYIDPDVDKALRARFPIQLPETAMTAATGRW